MSNGENITPQVIVDMIIEAGLDHHDFKTTIIAKRAQWDAENGYDTNLWEEIAEFPWHTCSDADHAKAWELAGVPNPYLDKEEEAA